MLRKWAECQPVVLALVPHSPPHMSAAQETPNTRNKLFYLRDRILHDEHVRDVAKLAEVLAQLVLAGLPTEAPDEEFARS